MPLAHEPGEFPEPMIGGLITTTALTLAVLGALYRIFTPSERWSPVPPSEIAR